MDEIVHKGKVVEITPEFTTVEIVSESACSACHARGLCGVSESKTKAVQIPSRAWDSFNVGDEVDVCLKASMGHKAVFIAYVAPLFVLLVTLLLLLHFGWSELAAAFAAFLVVAVYYFCIWLCRDKLRNEYIFNIRK